MLAFSGPWCPDLSLPPTNDDIAIVSAYHLWPLATHKQWLATLEQVRIYIPFVHHKLLLTFVVAANQPNLNLSPEEKRAYGQLFRQADTESVGIVTGDVAVSFFEKTRLDSRILGEVSLSVATPYDAAPLIANVSTDLANC